MSPSDGERRPVRHPYPVSVSMTNLLPRFLPRTVSQGSAIAPVMAPLNAPFSASTHALTSANRSFLPRAAACPRVQRHASAKRLDGPGSCPSWDELLGQR